MATSEFQSPWRRDHLHGHIGDALFSKLPQKAITPLCRPAILRSDNGKMPIAFFEQKTSGRTPDLLVRKADNDVDRRRREIPCLDDRYLGRQQLLANLTRMSDARQKHGIGLSTENRCDQFVFARFPKP